MKTSKLIVLVVISLMLGATLAIIAYSFYYIEGMKTYNASIVVGGHIGFDTDNETLAFGMVMPGTASSTRFIMLKNRNDYPVIAEFEGEGEIGEWISLHGKEILLEPLEIREIRVSATAPPSAQFGNYTGRLKIIFKKSSLLP